MGFARKNQDILPIAPSKIDRYISRGQSPRYFSTRYQGRLKTRIAAKQTRYDRFQTTFYCEFE